ncbi:peptidoglycan DD-metalloendopeptidase family protein [Paraburkholderia dinghuensis]|uniref:LysM peptidoglycan-binding domain-containing protein n=1 Tax=Paraburkholderia dinghuensis TaxID=2305225 RepID=A0A3N6N6E0_9BURK|nr:peptidoglycan DD-metalloendopeptidase family protein [Paraburkholderia dinghuensis]RQH04492.1 LysM peptidoglycan-binding domain-containing protein [Paraburkholderia dinghuensis]
MRANLPGYGLTTIRTGICAAALCVLTACATRLDPAPVVDMTGRGTTSAPVPTAIAPVASAPVPLPPVPPGFYRVKPGDTLSGIARSHGQSNRDVIAWNNLSDPNHIEVDQALRVVPPQAGGTGVTPASASASAPAPVSSGPAVASTGAPAEPAMPAASSIALGWPARGPLLSRFDETRNKGIDIGGTVGEPVRAAANGRVVYAGNGLRGYGNLIIVKSDASFLTAYAHNRDLKVKEGDSVTKGQQIAEMGNSDSDRVKLHFEVRRDGKPVDPMRYLPPQ